MSILIFLYIALGLWFVQQVNDNLQAFLNRQNVPKLYWLSAAASFLSGSFLFYYCYSFFDAVGNIVMYLMSR